MKKRRRFIKIYFLVFCFIASYSTEAQIPTIRERAGMAEAIRKTEREEEEMINKGLRQMSESFSREMNQKYENQLSENIYSLEIGNTNIKTFFPDRTTCENGKNEYARRHIKKYGDLLKKKSFGQSSFNQNQLSKLVKDNCRCSPQKNPNYKPKASSTANVSTANVNTNINTNTNSNTNINTLPASNTDNSFISSFGENTTQITGSVFEASSARDANRVQGYETDSKVPEMNLDNLEAYSEPTPILEPVLIEFSDADIKEALQNCINLSSFCECVQYNFTKLTGKNLDGKHSQIRNEEDIAKNKLFNEYLRKVSKEQEAVIDKKLQEIDDKFRAENKHLEMAEMSSFVYHEDITKKLPKGWHEIKDDDLPETQRILKEFNSDKIKDGFYAEFYCKNCDDKENKEYVLAFRGTRLEKIEDLIANVGQASGSTVLSGQYYKAMNLAKHLKKNCNDCTISITGHSLGGGLASVAGLASGLPTYTFNAAGVHPNTIKNVDFDNKANEKKIIKAYYAENDPLNWMQDNPQETAAILTGADIIIPKFIKNYVKNKIKEETDLETSIALNKIIDNPISSVLPLPPALGERKNLGNIECEGKGCGHKIELVIKHIETPLENEKIRANMDNEKLKTALSTCYASE